MNSLRPRPDQIQRLPKHTKQYISYLEKLVGNLQAYVGSMDLMNNEEGPIQMGQVTRSMLADAMGERVPYRPLYYPGRDVTIEVGGLGLDVSADTDEGQIRLYFDRNGSFDKVGIYPQASNAVIIR